MGFLLPRAATATLAVLLLSAGALAQGIVDQQNDPSATSALSCGSPPILNGTILQSFVPQADNLIAVELRLQAGSSFPSGGAITTARIRAGTSTGTILGETTTNVAGPLSQGTQVLVRFDFASISLTPGNTYLIEWVTPANTVLMWVGSGGDPYTSGTAYSCSGNVWPVTGTDLNFITYKAEPPPPAPPPAEEAPPTCESILGDLQAAVAALGLGKYKQGAMNRLVEAAVTELGNGKPKSASALVLALEYQVRTLTRFGLIDSNESNTILTLAEEFRKCLGVEPKCTFRWLDWSDRHHDRHHH